MTVSGLPGVWCATDLGEYRACEYTYALYPHYTLPPLDPAQFTGDFGWLGGAGDPLPDEVARLTGVTAELATRGLALPDDFITFYTHSDLHFALDAISVTACWTDISDPLPSPIEPGAFLVRFLRDQQDCVIWYLYLRPSGETFVVHSGLEYEREYQAQREGEENDLDDPEAQTDDICWCAPTFEQFAYRVWVENTLWRAIHKNKLADLEPRLRAYLDHYAPSGTPA
ncbi:MAG: hypothetical protein WCA46_08390 [Actinocatenispora sp.]